MSRNVTARQRLQRKEHLTCHRGAVLECNGPEAACGKARLQKNRAAGPERGGGAPGEAHDVIHGQEDLRNVARLKALLRGVEARTPQNVGVGPDDALRPRGRPRGEHDGGRREGIGRATLHRFAEQHLETLAAGRLVSDRSCSAGIVGGHREPAQAATVLGHERREFRLRDGSNSVGRARIPFEFGARRMRIGANADRTDPCTGEACEQHLRAVLEMHENAVSGLDAAS